MYPLHMRNTGVGGYAVANDEAEHKALTDMGYEPKYVAVEADPNEDDGRGHTVASVRAQLDAAGIAYDKRFGLAKLLALLPA
jgi:hypothetical protein